jgi:hypothetical protein
MMQNIPKSDRCQKIWACLFFALYINSWRMTANEFSLLSYKEQLQLINKSGKLKLSIQNNDKLFSLYSLKDFFIELSRKAGEYSYDHLRVMTFDQLPLNYKLGFNKK